MDSIKNKKIKPGLAILIISSFLMLGLFIFLLNLRFLMLDKKALEDSLRLDPYGDLLIEAPLKDQIFHWELASTPSEWYQGLSNRPALCYNCGMIFLFPALENQSFVMRDMRFSLDIIFLANDRVVKVYENLPPANSSQLIEYHSLEPVNVVIEVNAGMAAKLNIQEGDIINILDDISWQREK